MVTVVAVPAIALKFGAVVIQKRRCPIIAITVMVPDQKPTVKTISTSTICATDHVVLGVKNKACMYCDLVSGCEEVFGVE